MRKSRADLRAERSAVQFGHRPGPAPERAAVPERVALWLGPVPEPVIPVGDDGAGIEAGDLLSEPLVKRRLLQP